MMGLGETGKAAHGKSQVTANPARSSLILVLYYPPSVYKNTNSVEGPPSDSQWIDAKLEKLHMERASLELILKAKCGPVL
ncbi:unnamed protein product [Sphagnum compactum]